MISPRRLFPFKFWRKWKFNKPLWISRSIYLMFVVRQISQMWFQNHFTVVQKIFLPLLIRFWMRLYVTLIFTRMELFIVFFYITLISANWIGLRTQATFITFPREKYRNSKILSRLSHHSNKTEFIFWFIAIFYCNSSTSASLIAIKLDSIRFDNNNKRISEKFLLPIIKITKRHAKKKCFLPLKLK